MPMYRFKCDNCGTELQKITSHLIKDLDCACGDRLKRQFPKQVNSTVMEVRDKFRGASVPKNLERNLKTRMKKQHDRYEIAEKIDKHGIDDAIRLGWTKQEKKV